MAFADCPALAGRVGGGQGEAVAHISREIRMGVLKRQNVVTTLRHDLRGTGALAPHRIDRHHLFTEVESRQQDRNRGDLVNFTIDPFLSDHQPIGACPDAHGMQGIAIERVPPGFICQRAPVRRLRLPPPLPPPNAEIPRRTAWDRSG